MLENELLIINNKEGKVVFEVGSGRIVEAGKIVGAMSKALFLFAKKIIQENIHFVRFEKQRMIFISSIRRPELSAVKLVSKSMLARDFVPAMSITLNIMVERLENDIFNEEAETFLTLFYHVLSNIEKTLIVAENSLDGITSLITLISGLIYDLGVSIDKIIPLIRIIGPGEETSFLSATEGFKYLLPVNGSSYAQVRNKTGLEVCPVTHPSEPTLMPNLDGERNFRTCARLFGPGSNSMKMYENTNNPETLKLCSLLSTLDQEKVLDAIKTIIDSGGRDINSILSNYVTIPEIPPEPAAYTGSTAEEDIKVYDALEVRDDSIKITNDIPVVNLTVDEGQGVDMARIPETIDSTYFEEKTETIEPVEVVEQQITGSVEPTPEQEIAVLPPPEIEGAIFDFASCLITTNVSPYLSGHSTPYEIPDTDRLELHVMAPENNEIAFLVNVGPLRVNEFIQSIRDISERVSGDIMTRNSTVIFKTPEHTFYTAYRGLLWSLIIEYISQIQLNVKRRTEALDFPNEGSIMLIPPGREFIRQKLPSQIMEIVEEDRIINEIETEQVQTVAKAMDTLLKRLVAPLRYGHGVALIPRKESQEMAEITLFLLLISEISGIGFSRW
ncbi:MAG: hypothetical protein ACXAEU_07535 [Candidatus Hodarchaeales archaeon]